MNSGVVDKLTTVLDKFDFGWYTWPNVDLSKTPDLNFISHKCQAQVGNDQHQDDMCQNCSIHTQDCVRSHDEPDLKVSMLYRDTCTLFSTAPFYLSQVKFSDKLLPLTATSTLDRHESPCDLGHFYFSVVAMPRFYTETAY